ncbi:hypothetical protein N7490_006749 [Penicillium lividum]|nr:hypothetical protein N7490_006749 [Penicillium lividum]
MYAGIPRPSAKNILYFIGPGTAIRSITLKEAVPVDCRIFDVTTASPTGYRVAVVTSRISNGKAYASALSKIVEYTRITRSPLRRESRVLSGRARNDIIYFYRLVRDIPRLILRNTRNIRPRTARSLACFAP